MNAKYNLSDIPYLSCRDCIASLMANLQKREEIESVCFDYNDKVVEIKPADHINKENLDSLVFSIEDTSMCERHQKNRQVISSYTYEGTVNHIKELDEELLKKDGIYAIKINYKRKTIVISHNPKVDSLLLLNMCLENRNDNLEIRLSNIKIRRLLSEKKKKCLKLMVYGLGLIGFLLGILFNYVIIKDVYSTVFYLLSYVIFSSKLYLELFEEIKKKKFFSENFLMVLSSLCAVLLNQMIEASALVILYRVGEYIEDYSKNKSYASIKDFLEMESKETMLKDGNKVPTSSIKINDIITIIPGSIISLDSVVTEGESSVDEKIMTGESFPREVKEGSILISGSRNISGVLYAKVLKEEKTSTVSELKKLIGDAKKKKSRTERFMDKFSSIYTPIVILLAVFLFVYRFFIQDQSLITAANNSIILLIISCPCALTISIPISYLLAGARLSKEGIIVKGSVYLERMVDLGYLVFDKTGTITDGSFKISDTVSFNNTDKKIALEMASYIESFSSHPVSLAFKPYYLSKYKNVLKDIKEVNGYGMSGKYNDKVVLLGSRTFLKENKIDIPEINNQNVIYMAIGSEPTCYFIVEDVVKNNAKETVSFFNNRNIKTIMLSGDKEEKVKKTAEATLISEYHGSLLPSEKIDYLMSYIKAKKKNKALSYVGDGMNDAPSLSLADIGISIGRKASDVAKDSADITVFKDDIAKIKEIYHISLLTHRKVFFNVLFAILFKITILALVIFNVLSAFSSLAVVLGILADTGVTIFSLINSYGIMRKKVI